MSSLPRWSRVAALASLAALVACNDDPTKTAAAKPATPTPVTAPTLLAAKTETATPVDPRARGATAIAADPGQFAIDVFVALNWPARPGQRGLPAGGRTLGSANPTVWETFKNASEIYLAGGATPAPWNTINELPGGIVPPTTAQLQQQFGMTDSPWLHFLSENAMIDGQRIVDANGAGIRYDVRGNEDHFNYIASNPSGYALYTLEGQQAALKDNAFTFNFPASAFEVKAAWRILQPTDDASRYWTAYGAYLDPTGKIVYAKIGLTAFHIISHMLPNWIWTTFEQVDNPTATFTYFLGQKDEAVGKNPTINPAAATYNQKLQQQTAGTKWQFYQLMGWQLAETDANGKPVLLANMNIETYFPKTSSCMSCHAMANIGPAPNNIRLDMWDYSSGGIEGRVGTINFPAIAQKMKPGVTFKPMNFVWSLREAHSTAAPAKPVATTP